ncbi:hypothetical protein PIIN_01984 [Serendipita indica DSM 11827]|uniref:Uncharacterized protein n=1 Tax=Serendipita indica (strain DSM 11827) TaxID=1109443 RepID=G4T9W7_SERID|nr:hypothetical protein PIIN_01984 [Serendipita indica DSM 11827]
MTTQPSVPLNQGAAHASINATKEIAIPHLLLAATPFANGGGDEHIIPDGKFKNRRVGRGTRNEIYGSARYGSGYGHYTETDNGWKYEPDTANFNVTGRDFHFGFPPISWGNYSGGFDYFWVRRDDLPGAAFVGTFRPYPYDEPSQQGAIIAKKNDQTWIFVADAATVNILFDVLRLPEQQGGCALDESSAKVTTRVSYDPLNPDPESNVSIFQQDIPIPPYIFHLQPWNVVQYYRGSSAFLANSSYDNEYAHQRSNNTDYWKATPLNTTGLDSAFLNCLNTTIAATIPIIDPTFVVRAPKGKLSSGQIAGIAVGSVMGALLLVGFLVWLFIRRRRAHNTYNAVSKGDTPPSHSSSS